MCMGTFENLMKLQIILSWEMFDLKLFFLLLVRTLKSVEMNICPSKSAADQTDLQ